jgi:hypothetical protein
VAEFSGEADMTTRSFDVRDGWAIRWESTGDHFAYAIRGNPDIGKVIDIAEPGTGVTSPVGSGTFHLEVTADGHWSIQIVQGQ